MMTRPEDALPSHSMEQAATEVVELGNRIADANPESDPWDIADGLLAGALHYWLYTRQPCSDPMCEDCAPISSAEQRMMELTRLVSQMAVDSDYYHTPNDHTVGRA